MDIGQPERRELVVPIPEADPQPSVPEQEPTKAPVEQEEAA